MRKRIFISFDYTNDNRYRNLLSAFSANPKFDIEFIDATPDEIQSHSVDRVKAALTNKILYATHTLVIIGEYANSFHPDRAKIGERNWQWWEINKSFAEGRPLIALKIKATNVPPEPIYNKGASWAHSFTVEAISNAVDGA